MECTIENDCLVVTQTVGGKIVVKAQSLIVDYSLQENTAYDTNGTEWVLFFVEDTGTILYFDSQQVTYKDRIQTCHSENLEIFSDLLQPKLEEQYLDADYIESTMPLFSLEKRHVLHKVEDKPLSICSYRDFLIVLSEDEYKYTFKALRIQHSETGTAVRGQIQNHSIKRTGQIMEMREIMLKIVTADSIEQDKKFHKTSDTLLIGNYLFKTLFGTCTVLVNSPVLLFCPPDGSVYHTALSLIFSNANHRNTFMETGRSDTQSLWKVLCDTSSAVVNILPLTIPYSNCIDDPYSGVENDAQVLLICCSSGTVTTFHIDPSSPEQEFVSQFFVKGLVLGTGTYCNRFYHSTISTISETSLEVMKIGDRKQGSQYNQTVQVKTTRARKQSMICHIHTEAICSVTDVTDAPCNLHCILKDGTSKRFDSGALFSQNCDLPDGSLQIKDVLTAIDKTGKDQQKLAQSSKRYNDKLEQISIAAFLQNSELTNIRSNEDLRKHPFDCKFRTVLDNKRIFQGQGHVDMECEITNQMPRDLNSDWSVEVSALSIGCNPGSKTCHTSTVVPLVNGCKTRETITVPIAVNFDQILSGCNMLVTMNLDSRHYLSDCEGSACLCIDVYQERIDVLHFLMSKEVFNRTARPCNTPAEVADHIRSLAIQHPTANLLTSNMGRQDDDCIVEVTIKKPVQFLRKQNTVWKKNSLQDPERVLSILLEDSNIKPEDIVQNRCHTITFTGKELYLGLKDIHNTATKTYAFEQQREINAVLYIQSDLSTAAAVSLAVDRKLKDIAMTNTGFPTSITARECQILLERIQALEKNIQVLNSKEMAEKEKRKETGKLYESLRSLGTVE